MLVVLCLLALSASALADVPCASRAIEGESNVCVCNATYCDEITRLAPTSGTFVAYMTSKAGKRFEKSTGKVESCKCSDSEKYSTTIKIDPTVTYQSIKGFGGAVTDSAALNWKNVSEAVQQQLINSYYSETGIEYNMIRVPIGGTDFSTRAYAYNEQPEDDLMLSNYSLTYDDYDYKIPMIKAINAAANASVHIVASTWSPANWMKTNDDVTGFSRLKDDCFQTYALYHLKFLQKYKEQGIDVWAVTTTNEPFNGVIPLAKFNSLGWSPRNLGKWVVENLSPTLRNSTLKGVKILLGDDQRYTLPIWFCWAVTDNPLLVDHIDGVAVHWYGDKISPKYLLTNVHKSHPEKFLLMTESCEGSSPEQKPKVLPGSWDRAVNYVKEIIENITHFVSGWIDWNLCLNPQGGPNWAKNYVDSPIIIYAEKDEFIKQPMFYALGHFSKFVPRDSYRVEIETSGCDVDTVAFLTPRDTIVCVIYNSKNESMSIRLEFGFKQAVISVDANSITTMEVAAEDAQCDDYDDRMVSDIEMILNKLNN